MASKGSFFSDVGLPSTTEVQFKDLLAHGQCRFNINSTTQLLLSRYNGAAIKIAGNIYTIPAAGVTVSNAGLLASTLYYAYVYQNAGVLAIELSTTGHSPDTTIGNEGIEIKTGDNTRSLVGMVYTDATATFTEATNIRNCASWFNRIKRPFFGSGTGSVTTTSLTVVEITTAARVEFVTWDTFEATVYGAVSNTVANANNVMQIGFDSTTAVLGNSAGQGANATANSFNGMSSKFDGYTAEGHHFLTPSGQVSAGTATWACRISGSVFS